MAKKFKIKPWMIIILVIGAIMIMSDNNDSGSRTVTPVLFTKWATAIYTALKYAGGVIVGIVTLKWLVGGNDSGTSIPIWAWFLVGFGVLIWYKKSQQQPRIIYS